jgi:hypothetical protein
LGKGVKILAFISFADFAGIALIMRQVSEYLVQMHLLLAVAATAEDLLDFLWFWGPCFGNSHWRHWHLNMMEDEGRQSKISAMGYTKD